MNLVIRLYRANPPTVFFSTQSSFSGQKVSSLGVRQVQTSAKKPENHQNMETAQKKDSNNPQEKTGDVMSHSFGEGYATRSDEEGFGGIYGGKQSFSEVKIDKEIHEDHPDYDKTQGSEVKEKEKARHQTSASN